MSPAQVQLEAMHEALLLLHPSDVEAIEIIRKMLRTLIENHSYNAVFAIMATCYEISIREGK